MIMKKLIPLLVLLSLTPSLQAQLWKSTADRIAVMTTELNLTPDQVTAVTAAFEKQRAEQKRIKTEVADEEKKAAYTAASKALAEDIKTVLTPEQVAANRELEKRHSASVKAAKEAAKGTGSKTGI